MSVFILAPPASFPDVSKGTAHHHGKTIGTRIPALGCPRTCQAPTMGNCIGSCQGPWLFIDYHFKCPTREADRVFGTGQPVTMESAGSAAPVGLSGDSFPGDSFQCIPARYKTDVWMCAVLQGSLLQQTEAILRTVEMEKCAENRVTENICASRERMMIMCVRIPAYFTAQERGYANRQHTEKGLTLP